MGNILTTVKRFLGNKNTVTILGVLLGILVLYVFYNYRVKQATTPVSVPYAKVDLSSRTLITEDMIGFMEVSSSVVRNSPNLITSRQELIDHYVAFGTTIPANSMFYSSQILEKNKMPDSAFANIPDGYTIYSLGVDLHSTYGNSIYPDNYIDLYFKAVDDTGVVMYGKLIESIRVLAVKDSQGNHVFETTVETRTPSELLFAVPDDMFDLLRRADYITGSSIEITPVPRNASYSASPGETLITSEQIKNFINAKSISAVQDKPIESTDTTIDDSNNNDNDFGFDFGFDNN